MSVLRRLGAVALAAGGLVVLFYLGFVAVIALVYGLADGPDSAGPAGVAIGVIAFVLAGGVAAVMGWLLFYAATGRTLRPSFGRAVLASLAGLVGVLVFTFFLLAN